MAKKFNITGLCFPEDHYMADVSDKLKQIRQMVEEGDYFIINRPRQYGKTTTLYTLADILIQSGQYIVFNISFEGIGDAIFNDEKIFSRGFVGLLGKVANDSAPELKPWLIEIALKTDNLNELGKVITELVSKTPKKVVLLIDEVDKSSNNQLFVSFLAMLRNRYLDRKRNPTFHSVVLAGVHDVKNLKLKIRPDEEQKYNSPWNIAADFKVDMNLYPNEIKPMLDEYVQDKNVRMNTPEIAERLFYYTSGYPFLVSKLCKIVDEERLPHKTVQEWTIEDIDAAARQLITESNTNFDSLIKNLENNPELYQRVYSLAIESDVSSFNLNNPTTNLGYLYGIFVNQKGLAIHNRIYREVIVDYMTDKMHEKQLSEGTNFGVGYKNADNTINMERVLLKFQAFMREQYSKKDRDFVERNGRLLFLAFIKPIINGVGYDFKEPQISDERRLDVVITYYQYRYVAELKVWYGEKAHEKGLQQLADYLDRQNLAEGYLLIFDHSAVKEWKSGWVVEAGKKIFIVWV